MQKERLTAISPLFYLVINILSFGQGSKERREKKNDTQSSLTGKSYVKNIRVDFEGKIRAVHNRNQKLTFNGVILKAFIIS